MLDEEWSNVQNYRPISRPIRFLKSRLLPSEVGSPLPIAGEVDGTEISSFYAKLTGERATSAPPLEQKALSVPIASTSSLPASSTNTDTELDLQTDLINFSEAQNTEPTPIYCQTCQETVLNWKVHSQSIAHILASNPSQPKPPTFYALKSNNIGRKLLEESGWDQESGLGLEGQGRKAPIKVIEKKDKLGIGLIPRKTEKIVAPGPIRYEGKGSLHYARLHKAKTDKWRAMYRHLNSDG